MTELKLSSVRLAVVLAASFFILACEPPRVNVQNTSPSASTSPAQTASPTPAVTASPQAVTLPVIDALFADETFANEAKRETGISDEQINKLKDRARAEVLDLNEDDAASDSRSTNAAVRRAESEIRGILGEDKAGKFIAFAQKRLSSENQENGLTPNDVPNDTRVVVNIPAYRMDLFEDGKLVKTYKIGIGYPEFPLPSGLRKATTIIFNPTWTPPDEPWVKGKFKAGQMVEAGSKDNPLGIAKVPIGLPSLIHGGKSAARLGKFASHGCVGLTDALMRDFALTLADISDTAFTETDIKDISKDRQKTSEIKLAQSVPVELRYETIVVEDGRLKIFRDVYERGTNTEENLRKVLDSYDLSLDELSEADRLKILNGLKQMARDAEGNPVSGSSNGQNSNANSAAVTKNAKGPTEFVFLLKAMSGKGYPAPLNRR